MIGSTPSLLPSPYNCISSSTEMKASSGKSCRRARMPPALLCVMSHVVVSKNLLYLLRGHTYDTAMAKRSIAFDNEFAVALSVPKCCPWKALGDNHAVLGGCNAAKARAVKGENLTEVKRETRRISMVALLRQSCRESPLRGASPHRQAGAVSVGGRREHVTTDEGLIDIFESTCTLIHPHADDSRRIGAADDKLVVRNLQSTYDGPGNAAAADLHADGTQEEGVGNVNADRVNQEHGIEIKVAANNPRTLATDDE